MPSKPLSTGVVVGKFYPYHNGHKHLIDTAREHLSGCLTVMVCDDPAQVIPATERARWVQKSHPDTRVIVVPDDIPDDSSAWAQRVREVLGYVPDAVFTSEDYGHTFAKELGCVHMMVDRLRETHPISGTEIRKHPLLHWQHLPRHTRDYLCKRVCLVGAESVGKSTLAKALAEHYSAPLVTEYGREFTEKHVECTGKMPEWTTMHFVCIAMLQNMNEDNAIGREAPLVICDTNAFATALWHERYMGYPSGEVERYDEGRRYDLYIIPDIDTPFQQDETNTREDGPHRVAMQEEFFRRLNLRGAKVLSVKGTPEERLHDCIVEIDQLCTSPLD